MKNNFIKAAVLTGLVVVASGAMGGEFCFNSSIAIGGTCYYESNGEAVGAPQSNLEKGLTAKQYGAIVDLLQSFDNECGAGKAWDFRRGCVDERSAVRGLHIGKKINVKIEE